MKIIYVTNARLPTHKAHGVQIMKACEAFSQSGVDVELIVPRLRPSFPEEPFGFYGVKKSFRLKKIFIMEILPLVRYHGKWFSHIQNFSFSLAAVIYLLLRGANKNRKIFYSRDYMTLFWLCLLGFRPVAEIHDYRSGKFKSQVNFILKKAKKIIVNSTGTLEALTKHYSFDVQKALVQPNGVDCDFFDIPDSRKEARDKLNINSDAKIISYIGQLETVGIEKGVAELIKAFKKLSEASDDTLLYIIGGPDNMIEKYKKQVEQEGIHNSRVIFAGQVSYRDIPVYLRAVDIVVVPFPYTPQLALTSSPLKIFEFMAAGKAILVSDLPSLRRHLNDSNSFFFKAEDINDLTEKLLYILSHDELAKRAGGRAAQDAQNYSWTKRAQNIMSFIKS